MKHLHWTRLAIVVALCSGMTVAQESSSPSLPSVELSARVLSSSSSAVVLEVRIQNKRNEKIYVARDPRQENGEKGMYVSRTSAGTALAESRVFPPPTYFLPSDDTSVVLYEIPPDGQLVESVRLGLPLLATRPPGDRFAKGGDSVVTHGNPVALELRYGYFLGRPVRDVANRRLRGGFPVALEDGRTVPLEALQLLTTTTVRLFEK